MAEKIHRLKVGRRGHVVYGFHCPACEIDHQFELPAFTWNKSLERPTFTPELVVGRDTTAECRCTVTDGQIIFHAESHHALAGQTVDLPDWD